MIYGESGEIQGFEDIGGNKEKIQAGQEVEGIYYG